MKSDAPVLLTLTLCLVQVTLELVCVLQLLRSLLLSLAGVRTVRGGEVCAVGSLLKRPLTVSMTPPRRRSRDSYPLVNYGLFWKPPKNMKPSMIFPPPPSRISFSIDLCLRDGQPCMPAETA